MDRSLRRKIRFIAMTNQPPLKPLHPETSLSPAKLATFDKWSTDKLLQSLAPDQEHCLKAAADGTMLDGHHRIHVLRSRNVDVETLARNVIVSRDEL